MKSIEELEVLFDSKRDRLRDIIAVSEQSEISDRDAWIEEQRHKWMCGEQPELPEDCPF